MVVLPSWYSCSIVSIGENSPGLGKYVLSVFPGTRGLTVWPGTRGGGPLDLPSAFKPIKMAKYKTVMIISRRSAALSRNMILMFLRKTCLKMTRLLEVRAGVAVVCGTRGVSILCLWWILIFGLTILRLQSIATTIP
jgi:hypothetical protein